MTATPREDAALVRWFLLDVELADVGATDEAVSVRSPVTGSRRESSADLAPTGNSFDIPYARFCDIEDRRVSETWSLPSGRGPMRRVGAIPELSGDRPSWNDPRTTRPGPIRGPPSDRPD